MNNEDKIWIEPKYFSRARRLLTKEFGGYFEVKELKELEKNIYYVKWENSCYSFGNEAVFLIDEDKGSVRVKPFVGRVRTEKHEEIYQEFKELEREYNEKREELKKREYIEFEKEKKDQLARTVKQIKGEQ